jgi:Xaa-Pro dipeptidase
MMAASEKEIKRRCDAIREKMKEEGLEALVLFSHDQMMYSGATRYISNFHQASRRQYLAFPLSGDPALVVGTLGHQYNAKKHSWIKDVRSGGETAEGMVGELAKALEAFKLKRQEIGIFGLSQTMPFSDYQVLTKKLPNATFRDATGLLDEIRMVKSPEEIGMVQETADMADRGYKRFLEVMKEGSTEFEVLAEVGQVLATSGAEDILFLSAKGPSFPGWIDRPGPYTFKKGDHYVFCLEMAGPSGYWTQIIRPVCLGKSNPTYERLFKVGKAALEAGAKKLIPGKKIGELVRTVGAKVKDEGFKTGLWCGHGMGLDAGDKPWLFPESTVVIKEGMVITIHPHVMSLDGKEGIYSADTFVVQKEGPRNFSHTPIDFPCI